MIIGISGKKGSGKDLIGKIIQGLTIGEEKFEDGVLGFLESYEDLDTDITPVDWEIKKFANKLKDIVCLLINCTREQLEDEEFKNKELGKEWWILKCYKGYGGEAGNSREGIEKYRGKLDPVSTKWDDWKTVKTTPRLLLQLVGTECMRNIINPDVWVISLMSEYFCLDDTNRASMGNIIDYSNCPFPNWIITDVRFPNELKTIKDKGGIVIRVNRDFKGLSPSEYKQVKEPFKEHLSETALDEAKFDYTIYNTGTIKELINKIEILLIKEKII